MDRCQDVEWQISCAKHLAMACFACGFDPQTSPPLGTGTHHLTQRVVGPHKFDCQMASKSVKRFEQGA